MPPAEQRLLDALSLLEERRPGHKYFPIIDVLWAMYEVPAPNVEVPPLRPLDVHTVARVLLEFHQAVTGGSV